jgi:hypothetical protein
MAHLLAFLNSKASNFTTFESKFFTLSHDPTMGMDRMIRKKTTSSLRILGLILAIVFGAFVFYLLFLADSRSKLRVEARRIYISKVKKGLFEDFISRIAFVQAQSNGKMKVQMQAEERWFSKLHIGQKGSLRANEAAYRLKISKIHSKITKGHFAVEMEFDGSVPDKSACGQSFVVRLYFGQASEALLLPVGGFYSSTGGNWVYVLDQNSETACKRPIKIGRKNADFYEILEGLQEGERIIASPYEDFGQNEVLILK